MNITPDETLMALWLEDELTGEELVHLEAWAATRPDQLAARDAVREWKSRISIALPASEEPPYADFFNSRISRAIREAAEPAAPLPAAAKPSFWRLWWMPATAFAGMAMAFLAGRQTSATPPSIVTTPPPAPVIQSIPIVYTPDRAVKAEWFDSNPAAATVIVLQGIDAIPDTIDFWDTASLPAEGESSSTAEGGPPTPTEIVQ